MEIKASGKNDREAIKALTDIRQYQRRNPRTAFIGRTIWLGLTIAILWAFVLFTSFGKNMMGMAMTVTVIFALWILVMLLTPRLAYSSNGKLAGAVNQFTFTDDSVNIEGRGEGFSSEGSFSYDNIDRIYETSRYIIVYINKLTAYIIDRETIAPEDYEQLKNKLISAVGKKKYFVCKY